jgi:aminoglycoside phosphotransferase family enzyme
MPDTAAKLAFLRSPQAYGGFAAPPECLETHMSWLFLLRERVFKLKKPVRFPFLDFSTLASREFYCREEVRLNARLAPGVYLGLFALQWRDGAFALVPQAQLQQGGSGETQDWLVCMRRLALQDMLDQRIGQGCVTPSQIDALVQALGAFYRQAPRIPLNPDDYLARLQLGQASNREVLLRPQFELIDVAQAINRFGDALLCNTALLRERASGGRVLDGHGDLRPEHVCLCDPPVVIDCLEFNPQMRQVDPFDEIAYLALECDLAGAPWIGPRLLAGCAAALDEHPAPALIHLYTAYRALLRARLTMAHLLDPQPRTPQKWLPLAARYIAHAQAALDALQTLPGPAQTSHGAA